MAKFRHLTKTKRLQLESYLLAKLPAKEIAPLLNVHLSTVYREIKRGTYMHKIPVKDRYVGKYLMTYKYEERYSCDIAEDKYRYHLSCKGADIKLGKDYELANYIEKRIVEDKLSPVAVIGEIRKNNMHFKTSICVNTLYNYIYKGVFATLEMKHLPMKKKQKKVKNNVTIKKAPRGKSIEDRPREVSRRNTFGHWEMDCVCGPTKSTLLVLTERLTRKEIILPMPNQESKSVVRCLNSIEHKYGRRFKDIFKTITVDNGCEFSDSNGLEKSKFGKGIRTQVYYCHPYCSSERGTNERINREIRRLIPKGSDLSKYSRLDIQRVEDWVNNYPRRIFGFATSAELFNQYVSLIN